MAASPSDLGVRPATGRVQTAQQEIQEPQGEEQEIVEEPVQQPEESPADLKARLSRAEQIINDERENSKFLKQQLDRATGTPKPGQVQTAPQKPKYKLPENLFTTMADPEQFGEVLEGWARANGFLTADEANSILNSKVMEVGKVGAFYQAYPDLNDQNSDLYKDARRIGEWVYAQPEYAGLTEGAKTLMVLRMAAERAEGLKAAGAAKAQAEKNRTKKIAAQTGPVGGGAATGAGSNEDLTPDQKRAADNLLGNLPPKERYALYAKHATQGVTMMRKGGQ